MAKENDNGVREFQFQARDTSSNWQKFKRGIYNPETKEYLGRTPKNWGQLLIFYTIFYVILAALFAICMQGLFATLIDNEPKYKLDESLIGTNPGLGFRPISDRTEDGSLIWYNVTNATTVDKWVNLLDGFLEHYNKPQTGENFVNCNFSQSPPPGYVCVTDLSSQFGNCTPENKYGYNTNSPCIFLKLNRIFNWKPEFYTEPIEEMPKELQDHILSLEPEEREQIWVTCQGEDDIDKEMANVFEYYPRGFAGYYYPYTNTKNYLSPLIAVRIRNPKPNIIITIECRAWAKNIEFRRGSLNRAGSVQFEIMVDTEYKPVIINASSTI
ncbi:sodium/potassium-transporting ATPase subunit beta-1 [Aethina tumida]|uniref:sodium/potassium-transporting ATPase subunit beta-1 n=1 Tax=Aethina tumida TaxID=116153 RepID=UPI00096B2765|nr:sodium/potassium-transporting ATPase subunit beta-1 [Aethina tumida]